LILLVELDVGPHWRLLPDLEYLLVQKLAHPVDALHVICGCAAFKTRAMEAKPGEGRKIDIR
jgi:hypothetical protein